MAFNSAHKYFIQPAFNSAFGGSNLGEAKSYLRWAIKQGNLKQALLVFDDKSMAGGESKVNDFGGYFDNPSRYKILFSYQTFYDSTATIRKQKQVPLFESNGQRTEASLLEQVRRSGSYYEHSLKVEREHMASYKKLDILNISYQNFIDILEDCYINNVSLDIAISPLHVRLLEAIDYRVGLEYVWYKWKKDIVAINENTAARFGKKPFRIIDFGIYNEITMQELPKSPDENSPYYWEASHYKARLGDMMLDFLAGRSEHSGLGVDITSKNIDAHIEKQKSLRAKFIDTREYRREVFGE